MFGMSIPPANMLFHRDKGMRRLAWLSLWDLVNLGTDGDWQAVREALAEARGAELIVEALQPGSVVVGQVGVGEVRQLELPGLMDVEAVLESVVPVRRVFVNVWERALPAARVIG